MSPLCLTPASVTSQASPRAAWAAVLHGHSTPQLIHTQRFYSLARATPKGAEQQLLTCDPVRSSGLYHPLRLSVDLVSRFFSLSRFHLLLSYSLQCTSSPSLDGGVTDPVCILLTCLYQSLSTPCSLAQNVPVPDLKTTVSPGSPDDDNVFLPVSDSVYTFDKEAH